MKNCPEVVKKINFYIFLPFVGLPKLGPISTYDITNTSCNLSWEPIPHVKYYIIEYFDSKTLKWSQIKKVTEPKAELTGLNENMKYKLRVFAETLSGDTDPVEIDVQLGGAGVPKGPTGWFRRKKLLEISQKIRFKTHFY